MVREQACQRALTPKQTLGGGGALQRGHGAPLEPLAELGDALSGEGALAILDAAQRVVSQAVSITKEECQRALTQKRTLRAAAHLRLEIFVSLRTAASLVTPSSPMRLSERL